MTSLATLTQKALARNEKEKHLSHKVSNLFRRPRSVLFFFVFLVRFPSGTFPLLVASILLMSTIWSCCVGFSTLSRIKGPENSKRQKIRSPAVHPVTITSGLRMAAQMMSPWRERSLSIPRLKSSSVLALSMNSVVSIARMLWCPH